MVQIDARGMSCPQPVLITKKALENNPEGVEILVDNTTAKMNVERFMKNAGYKVTIKEEDDSYKLSAIK